MRIDAYSFGDTVDEEGEVRPGKFRGDKGKGKGNIPKNIKFVGTGEGKIKENVTNNLLSLRNGKIVNCLIINFLFLSL